MNDAQGGLSPGLRRLVGRVEGVLGRIIAEAEGPDLFAAVEKVRRQMVRVRDGDGARAETALGDTESILHRLAPGERAALARAFTIYLELVNVCENAYRTHRLRRRRREEESGGVPPGEAPGPGARVVWVLTAHPTESRSPANIGLMRRIQDLCIEALEAGEDPPAEELRHLLHLVWRTGTHPAHKPTVADEARHLFSLVDDCILAELLDLLSRGHQVRLRTWVGGDKDGHPGVGPEETMASLQLSRERLLAFVEVHILAELGRDVALIPQEQLGKSWSELRQAVSGLERVQAGDGERLRVVRSALVELKARYRQQRGTDHPGALRLDALLDLFPGLVIPLELREERGLFKEDAAIAAMLRALADVARGGDVAWYVRGVVVSMTLAAEDLVEARKLTGDILGSSAVPVVPLFELPEVLPQAAAILEGALSADGVAAAGDGVEVMLGYSDTSKRMGVLSSRLAIHDAMQDIGRWAAGRALRLVFFHGSGGSVGRGGGTVEEQFATWPPGAAHVVKQTLQGEMVERTLATPEILRSQVIKIARCQSSPPPLREPHPITRRLAGAERQAFVEAVSSPSFLDLLQRATPYLRLGALNIGSRPSRRSSESAGIEKLRAIPWVLCWTQTRYLLHAWLGAGSAWRSLQRETGDATAAVRAAAAEDPLLRSYLRALGFTLAKTVPQIWSRYAARLAGDLAAAVNTLEAERCAAVELACAPSAAGELLADRVWLRESIHHRSPMIHPLNLLQIDVLSGGRLTEREELLYRETVTGIAAGMLTTG